MENREKTLQKLVKKQYIPFYFFLVVQIIYHFIMREGPGSDAMWFFRHQLEAYSLKEYLSIRYHIWTSRMLVEAVLIYVSNCVILWKILDCFMWMLFVLSLSALFRGVSDETKKNWLIVALVLMYPLGDLSAAGWIATTLNYIWPLALGTFAMTGIVKVFYKEKIRWWNVLLYALALLYAANVEQMCAVLLGIYTICILYLILKKARVSQWMALMPYWAICMAEFVFIMTCSGNAMRKQQEIKDFAQYFSMYNAVDKVNIGFVSAGNQLLTSGNLLFLVLAVVLAILVFQKTTSLLGRFVSLVPIAWNVMLVFFKDVFCANFEQFSTILFDHITVVDGENYVLAYAYLPFVLYSGILLCILICLAWVSESWEEFFCYFFLLGIGLASCVVLGFTPTLSLGQNRIYLYLYMIIIAVIVALVERNRVTMEQNPKMMQALKLGGACVLLFVICNNLMSASII